jgi:4-amino-4-deoxy-L-arabinose transferase-like glycosyltransferase
MLARLTVRGNPSSAGTTTLPPIAWRVVGVIAGITTAFHLATANIAQPHRDEFYYLEGGHHPAFGYVDHPPIVPLLYRAGEAVFSHSQFALHVLPSLLGGVFVIVAALLACELGGRAVSQGLCATLGALGPLFAATSHFLSTVTLDILAWSVASLLVIRIIRTGNERLWVVIGLVIGLGMENKHTMLFWSAGAFVGLMATPQRRILVSKYVLGGAAIAIVITLPNVIWQIDHDWPTLDFLRALRDDNIGNRGEYLPLVVAAVTVGGVVVWTTGLVAMFRRGSAFASARWIGVGYLFLVVAIFVVGGKGYYVASWYLPLIAVGAVVIEQRWSRSATIAVFAAVIVTGLAFVPFFTPVFSEPTIVGLGLDDANEDLGGMLGWRQFVDEVATVFDSLPPQERNNAVIVTGSYSEAGSIDFWRSAYDLPEPYSDHNSYWWWGHPHGDDRTVVAVGIAPVILRQFWDDVHLVKTLGRDGAPIDPEQRGATIAIARRQMRPWSEIWPRLRHYG